jgi:hypothetical protein
MSAPVVSFVVPAKDEVDCLPVALERIRNQRTAREFEVDELPTIEETKICL